MTGETSYDRPTRDAAQMAAEKAAAEQRVKDQEAGAITRADVAAFCLDAVIEPEFQFLKQAVSISSNMGSGFQSVLADKTKSRMAAQ